MRYWLLEVTAYRDMNAFDRARASRGAAGSRARRAPQKAR